MECELVRLSLKKLCFVCIKAVSISAEQARVMCKEFIEPQCLFAFWLKEVFCVVDIVHGKTRSCDVRECSLFLNSEFYS